MKPLRFFGWYLVISLSLVVAAPTIHAQEASPRGVHWSVGVDSLIVETSPQPGKTAQFAAAEITRYLKTITAGRIEIAIATGSRQGPGAGLTVIGQKLQTAASRKKVRVDFDSSDSDAYVLRVTDGELNIDGRSERAVLYGVYDVLERLGCRWFGPGLEHVPIREAIHLDPIEIREKPEFSWRGLELISGSTPEIVDWMAKLRFNVTWPESYVPNPDMTCAEDKLAASAISQMQERGMSIFWGGHILPYVMPMEKYKTHPEYFAQIAGERLSPKQEIQNRNQLCVSNPEVLRVLTQNTIEFLRNHPWVDVLFLWAGDTVQWCECEQCRALVPDPERQSSFGGLDRSALYTLMVKAVSEGVQEALPDRRIALNHYYNLENLPTDKDGKVLEHLLPATNVLSGVDDYHQCNRHCFADANCPRGKRIEPISRMWKPYFPESVSWSYYFAWNFTVGLPVSETRKIPQDFQFLRSLGIRGMVDNVSLEPKSLHWFNNLRNFYIYGKASWNPDIDVDAVMRDFDQHFYGPAANTMNQAWQLIDEATTKYGLTPEFMPENPEYAQPAAIHGRMIDIAAIAGQHNGVDRREHLAYLIPNRQVYSQLTKLLDDARTKLATSNSVDAIYLDRVSALKAVVDAWDTQTQGDQVFGFFNGGGYLRQQIYTRSNDGTRSCSIFSGNNIGDCFWSLPAETEQLANPGDSVELQVTVNATSDVVGSPLYRGGPGLYQSADQTTIAGTATNHSVNLFIGNKDNIAEGHQVSVCVSDGGYATSYLSSPDKAWKFQKPVTLRIDYVSATESQHVYRYLFDAGDGWVDLGTSQFAIRLPFAAPSFHFSAYDPLKVKYPINNWSSASDIVVKRR